MYTELKRYKDEKGIGREKECQRDREGERDGERNGH